MSRGAVLRRSTITAVTASVALTLLGVAPAAHAASVDLYADPAGSDANACSSGSPCKTLQHVLDVAGTRGGEDVTIHLAAGDFDGALVDGGTERSLDIVGSGLGTVVHLVPLTLTVDSDSLTFDGGLIVFNLAAPVTVANLTVSAPAPVAGAAGTDGGAVGGQGGPALTRGGIISIGDGPLAVTDVTITGIHGGAGGKGGEGTTSGGTGGTGGEAYGIAHVTVTDSPLASTVLRGVTIDDLTGGVGGDGGNQSGTTGRPGSGGLADGVYHTAAGPLVISSSTVHSVIGGASGGGDNSLQAAVGGDAQGIATGAGRTFINDTTVTEVTGGTGGVGTGVGIAGGRAFGINSMANAMSVDRVDVGDVTGGHGGAGRTGSGTPGGPGNKAYGIAAFQSSGVTAHATTVAFVTGGSGGDGASVDGADKTAGNGGTSAGGVGISAGPVAGDTSATALVSDSTVTGVKSGSGGAGGAGSGGANGGVGGGLAPLNDAVTGAAGVLPLLPMTLRHVTVARMAPGTGGTGGTGNSGQRPGGAPGATASVLAVGAPVTLAASLLDDVGAGTPIDCAVAAGGSFTAGSDTVVSTSTNCGSATVIANLDDALAALTPGTPPNTPTLPLRVNVVQVANDVAAAVPSGPLCAGAGQNGAVRPGFGAPNCAAGAYEPAGTDSPTNTPPVAAFTATPPAGEPPLNVTFDGTGSHDPDNGDSIASYAWLFGDGTTGTGATPPVHQYAALGAYTVVLLVTDTRGATDIAVNFVIVAPDAPSVSAPSTPPSSGDNTPTAPDRFGNVCGPLTGRPTC